jgi:hypothetical protein
MKDENGRWQVIFKSCRVAKGKSTITNGSAGGKSVLFSRIYPELKAKYSETKIPDSRKIDETTIKIANYIEKEFGQFGELGVDIAIDIYGGIWIIEANAKPDKVMDKKYLDLEDESFVKQIFEEYESNNKIDIKRMPDGQGILPQAIATFKYAKYLVKCK